MMSVKAIDRIFDRLSAAYGSDWSRKIGATPIQDVKTVWADELAPYGTKEGLEMVAWALSSLPESAPNAIQFKNLVRQAPRKQQMQALPAPANPERLAHEMKALGEIKDRVIAAGHGMRQWAHDLKARHESGAKLTKAQRDMYKEALKEKSALPFD